MHKAPALQKQTTKNLKVINYPSGVLAEFYGVRGIGEMWAKDVDGEGDHSLGVGMTFGLPACLYHWWAPLQTGQQAT
jgi:hypothetical protein